MLLDVNKQKLIQMEWIDSNENSADLGTKYWMQQVIENTRKNYVEITASINLENFHPILK